MGGQGRRLRKGKCMEALALPLRLLEATARAALGAVLPAEVAGLRQGPGGWAFFPQEPPALEAMPGGVAVQGHHVEPLQDRHTGQFEALPLLHEG